MATQNRSKYAPKSKRGLLALKRKGDQMEAWRKAYRKVTKKVAKALNGAVKRQGAENYRSDPILIEANREYKKITGTSYIDW